MAFEKKCDARVGIMLADGCEEIEALTVCDVLYRAGIPLDKVSLNGKHITSSHEVTFHGEVMIEDADLDSYDMLVLPGGMPGTESLAACEPLAAALKRFVSEGKFVAAICAAPSILANLGLLEGVHATSYPSYHELLASKGAILEAEAAAVVDGCIITSQGMGTALDFSYAIVSELLGDEAAENIARSIVDIR